MASAIPKTHFLQSLVCSLNIDHNEIHDSDLIVILLYTLMVESGFQPCDLIANDNGTYMLPSDWKDSANSLYRFTFVLGELNEYKCRFVGFLVGDVIECNIIVSNIPRALCTYTLCCSDNMEKFACGSFLSRFKNLNKLTEKIKSLLIYPVKCLVLNIVGIMNPSLIGLPENIKQKIIYYLDLRDVCNLAATCRCMSNVISDPKIWEHLYGKDFTSEYAYLKNTKTVVNNWKSKYAEEYKCEKRLNMLLVDPNPATYSRDSRLYYGIF